MNEPPTGSPPSLRYHPLYQLVTSRLREFVRQPEAVFWVYVFPILMVIALGIAFQNKSVEVVAVDAVIGLDDSVLQTLESDPRVKLKVLDLAQCQDRLRIGKSDLYVRSSASGIAYVLDPTRPNSLVAKSTVDELIQRGAGRTDVVAAEVVEVDEPGARYVDFLVPGLLGMGLMGGGLFGVGFAIVDLRIKKLLKRLLATPMKKTHFLASLMISRLIFMIPEIFLLLLFAGLAFGVKIYGSLLVLALLILLGAIQFGGVGLLVASRARTLEAASGLMNLVMLPMWTVSGVFFSYDRFPQAIQPVIKALPLTASIDALRATMLEGRPLWALWPEISIMLVWTVVTFALALAIFRWSD
jgi:ABC-type multidrug transport system permease subunit